MRSLLAAKQNKYTSVSQSLSQKHLYKIIRIFIFIFIFLPETEDIITLYDDKSY